MHPDFRLDRWLVQPSLNKIEAPAEAPGVEPESRTLGHRVMAVLVCLAERPGDVVTREDLIERVWEGAFTTDEALATAVYELRRALGDDARSPRFVETIRKRGFRLIAPVSAPAEPAADGSQLDEAAPAEPDRPPRPWATRAAWSAAAGMAAILAVTTLFPDSGGRSVDTASLVATSPTSELATEPRAIRSLAVRPLSSFTEECRQDFFAGGLTEMLIADLVYLGPLDIIPAQDTSVSADPRADAIVEGSVLRSGDRLWISIQLVDSVGGQILWGGTYERELHDSLDLQQELSREISYQIISSLAASVVSGSPPSLPPAAWRPADASPEGTGDAPFPARP